MAKPKSRAEFREEVARSFVDALRKKGLDWKRGWDFVGSRPMNAVTKGHYNGINALHLGLIAMDRGYVDPRWCTMLQIMDKDGKYHPGQKWHLQAGSKASYVEYWFPYDNLEHKGVKWSDYRALPSEERASARYTLRVRYTPVFHSSMIEGIPPLELTQREPQPLDRVVSQLSGRMGVGLHFDGQGRAYYHPGEDAIHLPDRAAFHSEYDLNATALHELTHATGHASRLDRLKAAAFGSPAYAYEELVAEIGSCFMGYNLEVEQLPRHLENHQAYVQSWISLLEAQPERLAAAIGEAQKAADYMEAMLEREDLTLTEGKNIAVQPGSDQVEYQIHARYPNGETGLYIARLTDTQLQETIAAFRQEGAEVTDYHPTGANMPQQEIVLELKEKGYVEAHATDTGYSYSIYGTDRLLRDGGVLEGVYSSAYDAAMEVCRELKADVVHVASDYAAFMEQANSAAAQQLAAVRTSSMQVFAAQTEDDPVRATSQQESAVLDVGDHERHPEELSLSAFLKERGLDELLPAKPADTGNIIEDLISGISARQEYSERRHEAIMEYNRLIREGKLREPNQSEFQAPNRNAKPDGPVTRRGKLRFTDEQYRIAREASALEYARQQGYELVRQGSYYALKDHDSMIFTPDGRWFWNSQDLKGRAIEFLTRYEGRSLPEAVLLLNGVDVDRARQGASPRNDTPRYAPRAEDLSAQAAKADFKLPPKASNMRHIFAYLVNGRGIDYELLRQMVREDRLYESVYRTAQGKAVYNAVFVGRDEDGVARSASLRGCTTGSSFKMEAAGSDKTFPFTMPGRPGATVLRVYESAIDAMSHATIEKLAGLDWQDSLRIAQGGNTKVEAIERVLQAHPALQQVQFCLDNDEAGQKIYQELCDKLVQRGIPIGQISRAQVPVGKDWNAYLQIWRDTLKQYSTIVTTRYGEHGLDGHVVGRIHDLDENGHVAGTTAYRTNHHLREAARERIDGQAPCVVETQEQIRDVQKRQERSRQPQTAPQPAEEVDLELCIGD